MTERKPPPVTASGFQVLLALAAGHRHGYAVMRFVDEITGGAVSLGPGTLYRTIARLAADGLVEEITGAGDGGPHDARRRTYRLTPLGVEAAHREAELLVRLSAVAAEAGLVNETGQRTA